MGDNPFGIACQGSGDGKYSDTDAGEEIIECLGRRGRQTGKGGCRQKPAGKCQKADRRRRGDQTEK